MKKTQAQLLSVRWVGKLRAERNLKLQDSMVKREGGLVRIPLTQNKWAVIDWEDYASVKDYKWRAGQRRKAASFYAFSFIKVKNKEITVSMHRLINKTPKHLFTDHINGNGLDNRRENLRSCDPAENSQNRLSPSRNKTGFKGVVKNESGRFYARIDCRRKIRHLGSFLTAKEAAIAYNNAAIKYHSKFAALNKI